MSALHRRLRSGPDMRVCTALRVISYHRTD